MGKYTGQRKYTGWYEGLEEQAKQNFEWMPEKIS